MHCWQALQGRHPSFSYLYHSLSVPHIPRNVWLYILFSPKMPFTTRNPGEGSQTRYNKNLPRKLKPDFELGLKCFLPFNLKCLVKYGYFFQDLHNLLESMVVEKIPKIEQKTSCWWPILWWCGKIYGIILRQRRQETTNQIIYERDAGLWSNSCNEELLDKA